MAGGARVLARRRTTVKPHNRYLGPCRSAGENLRKWVPRDTTMPKLILELPPEVVDAVRLPPAEVEAELLKELALALYRRGALSLGKARTLAQLNRWQFEQLLGERRIARHYTEADLGEDLRYAHGHR
jgi:predicted HTH domain antitoxin